MKRSLLAATAALLLLPALAPARVRQAESILPPGQSGFVSLTGVTSGTGSPHLYDQQPLFTAFRYKSALFKPSTAGGTEVPRPGVTITRDEFGVPAIEAGNENDAWWGAGYAIAQDRLFQIELFRRATTGRLAEILGPDYLDDDLIARRDYYTGEELERMFRALPPGLQARAAAYRDGVNTWVRHVRTTPQDLPGEFAAVAVAPGELTEREQAAIGVFLARTVPSGDGAEIRNLRALRELGPKAFRALLPVRHKAKRETYTVPPREAKFKNQPGRSRKQEKRGFKRTLKAQAAWELPSPEAAAGARSAVAPGLPGRIGGSSMFAVRGPGGGAVLFNGPQLGFSTPELFVEVELHYPGVDLRGVTASGVPVMGIGHNADLAWGFTSGLSDEDDLYAETVTGPETYRFGGEEKRMECRDETFTFRSAPTDATGGKPPETGTKVERICRTVHGPVQLASGKTAYARRYAIWNREIETFVGIDLLNRAKTVQDVDAAMRQVTWNENVMAADSQGQIGYWHPGLHQLRPRGWDERLPYPGDGSAEWRGLRDRAKDPHVINPKQGWLANWNNLPARGWTSGDGEAQERLTQRYHRAQFLQRLVAALERNPSFDGAKAVIRHAGSTAQQRPLASTRLRHAARGASGEAATVLRALLAWDGSYNRADDAGTVEPGVAIWEEFKQQVQARGLRSLGVEPGAVGPGAKELLGTPGKSHEFDITNGEAYGIMRSSRRGLRAAARATFGVLAERFKTPDVTKWREKRRLYDIAAQGAGSAPELPFFDRGTWEQFVEVGP
ncbi:MAG TPA: penicillin acylase family protein [Solirubrobacteraceae bacterium]